MHRWQPGLGDGKEGEDGSGRRVTRKEKEREAVGGGGGNEREGEREQAVWGENERKGKESRQCGERMRDERKGKEW